MGTGFDQAMGFISDGWGDAFAAFVAPQQAPAQHLKNTGDNLGNVAKCTLSTAGGLALMAVAPLAPPFTFPLAIPGVVLTVGGTSCVAAASVGTVAEASRAIGGAVYEGGRYVVSSITGSRDTTVTDTNKALIERPVSQAPARGPQPVLGGG